MRIGLDFDNTLVCYDRVFAATARGDGLIDDGFVGSKREIRDAIRSRPGGEMEWQALQGRVYGSLIGRASLAPGAGRFLEACRQRQVPVVVVSHKTEYGHFDPMCVNLRDAARAWMTKQGFFDASGFGLNVADVFFEDDRSGKIGRIAALGISHFVDDLDEVFRDPAFPASVERCLYAPGNGEFPPGPFVVCRNWDDIGCYIFGRDA